MGTRGSWKERWQSWKRGWGQRRSGMVHLDDDDFDECMMDNAHTSPSIRSPDSTSASSIRSGEILRLRLTNLPRWSPSSPTSDPLRLGDLEIYRPASDSESDTDIARARMSGDEGGVRDGVREVKRGRFAVGPEASSLPSSSCPTVSGCEAHEC